MISKEKGTMAKDPVCGMEVDEATAAGKREYRGTVYYFCALGCMRVFDEDPEKFVDWTRMQKNDHPSRTDDRP